MNRMMAAGVGESMDYKARTTPGKSTPEHQGYICDNCGERAQIQNKYILQMPNVYTIGL